MLPNIAYYAIDSYPLFHILRHKIQLNSLYNTKFKLQSSQY